MFRSARLIIPQGVADITAAVGHKFWRRLFLKNNLKLSKMKLKIKNPFKALSDNIEMNRREYAIAEVNKIIQLREFEGKIWLCYCNIPIVEQNQLRDTLCNTLASTREAVCRYYKLKL